MRVTSPDWPAQLFARIARPRLPGTPALAAVQGAIAERLEALGYRVERRQFDTSPRRLTALGIGATGLGWIAILAVPMLVLPVPAWLVPLTGIAALTFTALLASAIADGRFPMRAAATRGVNIVAQRGAPRCWLVAHSDSKSQSVSLAGRVVAGLVAVLGVTLLVIVLLMRTAGPLALEVVVVACAPALVGGVVLSLSRPHNDSAGAVDNATGVIAALVAADSLRIRDDVGVLITDAEEFGLDGARAWVGTQPRGPYFVNFDGLDDRGAYRIMRHSSRRDAAADRDADRWLATAVADVLRSARMRVVVSALPPGVLVDGLALAKNGMVGVTVSRGDWRTLRVIHTRRDDPGRVTVGSAVTAGRAAARAVERLLS